MKVTLPSGARVEPGAVDHASLALADHNALRAIEAKLGLAPEEPITITCRNCAAPFTCRPCAALALGPFEDGELHDPELDARFDFDAEHPIPRVRLVGGAHATAAKLATRTVAESQPLRDALGRKRFVVTPAVVRAMGIVALGPETRVDRIAKALETASDAAWGALGDLFLEAHYPLRLFAAVPCPDCGARNDVDAPYDREFEPSDAAFSRENKGNSNAEAFPTFDEFADEARALADRELAKRNTGGVAFVVEGGVPACDDGGEPLLGCYEPAVPGAIDPSRLQPTITVFFRTFRAIWDDEGPYDWRAELDETIAHELDHRLADLAGDDPVDDEERAEIAREAARIHGKKALARGVVSAFGADVATFVRRTWLIWLLLAFATIAAVLGDVR